MTALAVLALASIDPISIEAAVDTLAVPEADVVNALAVLHAQGLVRWAGPYAPRPMFVATDAGRAALLESLAADDAAEDEGGTR